ncbi:Hint domain-containing protein [Roseovarius sp. D22-M7]|uniref:Hint domain-containing protein n=1 Tax=Roseovarius sp. D22-M7 TaxID=3127116 RepID=UPI00300F813C
MTSPDARPAQSIPVFDASDFRVVSGANLGDALSFADELDLDDMYELGAQARTARLDLVMHGAGPFMIGDASERGCPGARVHLDCALTLMAATGGMTEMLVFVEVDAVGDVAQVYGMPLARITPRTGYALVGVAREGALRKFAQAACVAFTAGTHITLASGAQTPVELLRPGDMVLTRDDGPCPVRWLGRSTVRAVGDFAPVRIKAGTLHNEGDLLVSPDHRLLIYQRSDAIGAGRPEVLVRARHLVNGDSVRRETGGFVEYCQILFDAHQIIYAEGIAAETLLVDPRTRAALPRDVEVVLPDFGDHAARPHLKFEASDAVLTHPDAAGLLKRASIR